MDRPPGVLAIAILFVLTASYLLGVGGILLVSPGAVSMAAGAFLLGGLELAGPFMFLLAGGIAALIGWGLLRLYRWARCAAILAAIAGVVMLVPSVSAAAVNPTWSLAWGGLGIVVRVVVIWQLSQGPAEKFGSVGL
jgi:hypothetical protein